MADITIKIDGDAAGVKAAAGATDQALAQIKSSVGSAGAATSQAAVSSQQYGAATQKAAQQSAVLGAATQKSAAELRNAGAAGSRTAAALQDVASQSKSAEGGLSSITRTAVSFGVGLAGVNSALSVLKGGFSATVGAAAGYEKQLNILQAVSGATAAEMKQISTRAVDLGNDLTLPGTSAADAAAAMTELAKAGLSVNETMSAAKGVLQLSAAGQIANATAAEITAGALNAFKLSGSEAVRVADLLAAGANSSAAGVTDMALALKSSSAVWNQANQSIEDLTTGIALMANAGIKGADAGTSLKTAMLSLMAPTSTAAGEMNRYGINVRDAEGKMIPLRDLVIEFSSKLGGLGDAQRDAALATIFGTDAVRAAQIVFMSGAAAIDKQKDSVTKAGAAADLAGAQMKGLSGALAGLQSSFETIGLQIGMAVLPGLSSVAEELAKGVETRSFQVITETITTMGQGLGTLAGLFLNLRNPITVATVAVFGLNAAFTVLAAHPVAATLTILAAGAAYLAGKLGEARKEAEELNGRVLAAGASATETYAKALRTIEAAGGGAAEKQAFLRAQVADLTVAYGKGNDELARAKDRLGEVERAHSSGSIQAQAQKKVVDDLTQGQINLYGSLQVAKGALDDAGQSLLSTRDAADKAQERLKETATGSRGVAQAAEEVSPRLQILAQALGKTAEEAGKIKDPIKEAVGWINTLTGAATQAELTWSRQTSALDAVGKSAKAMTLSLDPGQIAEWAANAHEMANSSGIAAPKIAELHKNIDIVARGGPNAAAALDRITKIIDEQKAPLDAAKEAHRSYATAQGEATKESLGFGGALRDLKATLDQFVNDFAAAMGKVPPSARDAMTLTKDAVTIDLSAEGAGAALSYAKAFGDRRQDVVYEGELIASSVRGVVSIDLSSQGAAAAISFAAGMRAKQVDVYNAGVLIATTAEGALSGVLQMRSPSRVMIERGEQFTAGLAIGIRRAASLVRAASEEVVEQAIAPTRTMASAWEIGARRAREMAGQLRELGTGLSALLSPARQAQTEIARLDAEIARLNRELASTEPYSERQAAIKADIETLEAWRGQVQANLTVAEKERAALEASMTAYQGAAEAREKYLREQGAASRFGPGAKPAGSLQAALDENSGTSGAQAFTDLESFLAALEPRFQEAANHLRFLFWQTLGAVNEEDRAMFLARFDETMAGIQSQQVASVTFSAQTLNDAYTSTLFNDAMIQNLGARGAALVQAIDTATREGGQTAIQTVAKIAFEIESEIGKLPAGLRGPLLAEWQSAWREFMAAPDDPTTQARLRGAVQAVNAQINLIPQNFAQLAPELQGEILEIIRSFDDLGLSAEQAGQRIQESMQRAAIAAQQAASMVASAAQQAASTSHLTVNQSGISSGSYIFGDSPIPEIGYWPDTPASALAWAVGQARAAKFSHDQWLASQAAMHADLPLQGEMMAAYATAQAMGLGPEAERILNAWRAGRITTQEAISQLRALIGRGTQSPAGDHATGSASAFGTPPVPPAGGQSSTTDLVAAIERVEGQLVMLRRELDGGRGLDTQSGALTEIHAGFIR
jgi:TP901 family phage tail tape measure protein